MTESWIRHVLSLVVRTAVMYLCYLPAVIIVAHFVLDGRFPPLLALLFAGSCIGIVIGLIPMKVWLEVLIGLLLSGAAVYGLFGLSVRSVFTFILLYAVLHLGMRSAPYSPEEGLPSRVLALGLAVWLPFPMLYRLDPVFREQAPLHAAFAVAGVAAALLLLNRTQLAVANLQDQTGQGGISPDIRLKNALYAIGMIAAIVATANLGAISAGLAALWNAVKAGLIWLIRLIPEQEDVRPEPAMPGGMPQLPIDAEPREPSPFWDMLQEILFWLVGVAGTLGLLGLIGYAVLTWLYPQLRRMLAGLNRERELDFDYLDETEKLETPDLRSALRRTVGRIRLGRPALPGDGRERVRMRYRMMLREAARDGFEPAAALTPAETAERLAAEGWRKRPAALLVRLYNPVRYGDKDVDPAELAELERAWDNRQERK